jgi:hypothetical protein
LARSILDISLLFRVLSPAGFSPDSSVFAANRFSFALIFTAAREMRTSAVACRWRFRAVLNHLAGKPPQRHRAPAGNQPVIENSGEWH